MLAARFGKDCRRLFWRKERSQVMLRKSRGRWWSGLDAPSSAARAGLIKRLYVRGFGTGTDWSLCLVPEWFLSNQAPTRPNRTGAGLASLPPGPLTFQWRRRPRLWLGRWGATLEHTTM